MDYKLFEHICKLMILNYFNDVIKPTNAELELNEDCIYVVWSCKTLQNNKALLSTTLPDGMYYEVTYNGDKDDVYFDAYKKVTNAKLKNVHEILAKEDPILTQKEDNDINNEK